MKRSTLNYLIDRENRGQEYIIEIGDYQLTRNFLIIKSGMIINRGGFSDALPKGTAINRFGIVIPRGERLITIKVILDSCTINGTRVCNLNFKIPPCRPQEIDQIILCNYTKTELKKINDEPIIKKSGQTYVARYKDVDYLCMNPDYYKHVKPGTNLNCILEELQQESLWKPFGEIVITDEVALLRPLIVIYQEGCDNHISMLTYVDDRYLQCYGATYRLYGGNVADVDFKLARVEDVKEFE